MPYIGKTPTAVPLTSSDITNDIITEAKIVDDAIENEHLNDNIISGQTELSSEPADTDEFLVSDAGTLKRIDYSLIKGGGITEADTYRLSANFTGSSGTINSNWERADTYGYSVLGTGISQSSGIFSFPSTGYYLILFNAYADDPYVTNYMGVQMRITLDNSSYNTAEANYSSVPTNGYHKNVQIMYIADVTNVSNVKIKFDIHAGDSVRFAGNTSANFTSVKFIRLGDT